MTTELHLLDLQEFGLLVAKTTLVLLATWLVAVLARRRSAADRHFVWLIGMMGAVLLPALAATPWRWDVRLPAIPAARFLAGAPAAAQPFAPSGKGVSADDAQAFLKSPSPSRGTVPDEGAFLSVPPTTFSAGGSANGVVTEAAPAPAPQSALLITGLSPAGPPAPPFSPGALLLIWAGVGAALIARTAAGHVQAFRHSRRAAAIRSPELLSLCRRIEGELGAESVRMLAGARNEMPKAAGLLRPWLELPADFADWPRSRQESVLRHEIAHVRRRDTLWEGVARIACAVNWFNPMVWFAATRLRAEREHACDDIVLLSGTAPSDYATDLLSVARQFRSGGNAASAAIAMARPTRLRLRLMAVLDDRRRTASSFGERGALIGAAGLFLLLMVGLASPVVAGGQGGSVQVVPDEDPGEIVRPEARTGIGSLGRTASTQPISTIDTGAIVQDTESSGAELEAAVGDAEAWSTASVSRDAETLLVADRIVSREADLERAFDLALRVTYRVTARLARSNEAAPMVPARIVEALRGTSFLEQMNVDWGGSTGQAQTLSASFTFPDEAALEAWQISGAGRAFHAAVSDAAVAGTVHSSRSAHLVY